MSSIIVLDSSDEDETPTKKQFLPRSIPATITPIQKTTIATTPNAKQAKSRSIPSGITVTRHSPVLSGSGLAISNSLLAPTTTTNIAKPQLPIVPKINAAFTRNHDRQTPTPPKQQQQLAQQLPQLQPSPHMRKRKTPTPPQRNLVTSPANAASPTLISAAQSMAASATPPLQLLATPPHTLTSGNFNDQLMINPHLIHTNLPQSTTITPQPSFNNNNNNNNFKIHLPPKRTIAIPSPAASPILRTPPALASPQLLPKANAPSTVRRIKPTTVVKHSDEAWLQRQPMSLSDNIMLEMLPSTSRSSSPKTSLTPKSTTPQPDLTVTRTQQSNRSSPQTPQSGKHAAAILDLTESPDKMFTSCITIADDSPRGNNAKLNGDTTENLKMDESLQQTNTTNNSSTTTVTLDEEPTSSETERTPLDPEYEELIKVCREADASPDMEKLIQMKLIKYYYGVHPDFVKSRGFRKNVRNVIERVRAEPDLVYYNVKTIVDELKVRRKSKAVVVNNEEASGTTGNKRTDEQIKKLNKALYILTKRIEMLEEAEVDWDDDDSSYLQMERFKKRACQIYEKICDLTGESKNAHRLVKKPIQFNGTSFPQFNKTLQAFINRTKEFPDYYDVMRMLEHCNRQYALGLVNFEMKRIAHDAFTKVGKLLQSRRKTDLYETVTHFTANAKDPAATDPSLLAKLSENQKNQTKISEILEKYAREQDLTADEQKEARLQEKLKAGSSESVVQKENGNDNENVVESSSDEDDDDEANLEDDVEKLTNGKDLSDAESDCELKQNHTVGDVKKSPLDTTQAVKETEIKETTELTISAEVEQLQQSNKVTDNFNAIVNNNVAREKTDDIIADINMIALAKQVPNGKVKLDDIIVQATAPSLKIVSVSCLNESVKKSDDVALITLDATNTTATHTSAAPQSQKLQKLVAEIVISDEES